MTYTFKTNIHCMGCISEIKPHLDKLEQSEDIEQWRVDTTTPDNILTVETNSMSQEEIEAVVQQAGFHAQSRQ